MGVISKDTSNIVEEIRQESQKNTAQFEKIVKEQNRKMNDIQEAITKLESVLTNLDVSYSIL